MRKVLVKYSEIGLKGKNKHVFENQLVRNIKVVCRRNKVVLEKIFKEKSRILCYFADEVSNESIEYVLKGIFGIKFFCYVHQIEKTIDAILEKGSELMDELEGKSISFKTKRGDKGFPVKSPDINAELGAIAVDKGFKINYKGAEETIYTEITFNTCYMYAKRFECNGGLPVGSSGRVLVLLSGGIDSPVAAWNMMRRGVVCDFVHFHTFDNNDKVMETKIRDTVEVLNRWGFSAKLYLVPYSMYEFLTSGKIEQRYELVFFKHFLLRFADRLADEFEYDAIVTGDNLAQVASQTIENLRAASIEIENQIFRPLLTYEKAEIIEKAKEIGTFDLAVQEYRDCCSIFSVNPVTKAKKEKMKDILEKFDVDGLYEKSREGMGIFSIR